MGEASSPTAIGDCDLRSIIKAELQLDKARRPRCVILEPHIPSALHILDLCAHMKGGDPAVGISVCSDCINDLRLGRVLIIDCTVLESNWRRVGHAQRRSQCVESTARRQDARASGAITHKAYTLATCLTQKQGGEHGSPSAQYQHAQAHALGHSPWSAYVRTLRWPAMPKWTSSAGPDPSSNQKYFPFLMTPVTFFPRSAA